MNAFEKFPESELMSVLSEKIESQIEKYSSLVNEVCRFREYIVQELRQINELFTEYTPHDEDYHISHLFKIADILLGKEKYQKMNIMELFLLIVSMYAHDWGMAVSKNERYYIATRKQKDSSPEINLLEDEYDRFEQFIKGKIGRTEFESDEQIDIDIWQEYIRNTHALRSGKRVYLYFEKYSNSIAGALEKICIGHWLEIGEISENNGYYKDASVFGENVNLKALSVYIRLIDLFDLAEDRTPYVLWKYVNPQNLYSKMEWEKHRALHQITCPSYEGEGRVICISGSTDNHEVYAALMDFKKICERYFRECIDMIAHMNDSRHELGVHLLDWRIEARNFKPIEVSFSFDKGHIFKILGDEIYNCHPYVYIRELIQNSIDAITLRKEILDRKKIGGDNIGFIHFDVEWESEDDLIVVCSDDGIGMDEYILRNYFSVLGKSYYKSDDFKNKGIYFNAISKFGIGILSCFSVASRMEITTKREPYMEEGRNGLKVIINDIKKTFRIEELPEYKCEVGTKIKLFIKKIDLIKQLEQKEYSIEDYSVTEYIKYIAHYIKYPIVVKENGMKTIILPLDYNEKIIQREIPDLEEYNIVHQVNNYPIKDIVLEQDMDAFDDTFEIRMIDIEKELGMKGMEGIICFATLKNYHDDITNPTHCWPTPQILVNNKKRIRWNQNGNEIYDKTKGNLIQNNCIMIYNKGILLEQQKRVWDSGYLRLRSHLFPAPYIKINFPNAISEISVSRFSSGNSKELIDDLWNKLSIYVSEELEKEKLTDGNSYEFWRKLTVYMMQFRLDIDKLDEDLFANISFPFINSEGDFVYEKLTNLEKVFLIPEKRDDILRQYGLKGICIKEKGWKYGKCLVAGEINRFYDESISTSICSKIYDVLKRNYCLKEVTFINDQDYTFPIEQYVYEKGDNNYIIRKLAMILSEFGVSYENDSKRIKKIYEQIWGLNNIVVFSDEYSQYFAFGKKIYNVENINMHKLIIYHWLLEELLDKKKCDILMIKNKKDQLLDLPFAQLNNLYTEEYMFSKINNTLKEFHIWLKTFYPNIGDVGISLSKKDFIDGTIELISEDCFKFVRRDNTD